MPSSRFQSWPVLLVSFAVLTVAFSYGLFSLPVFYPILTKKFGWNHAQAAGGGSIVLLLIGVLGPLVGWLVDRYGPKAVLLAGMCVAAIALLLLSRVESLGEYYAFCILLGIGSAAVSLVPTSMLIAPWFSKQRGLAVGVINAGVGVGGFVAPNLTSSLIRSGGIAKAFLSLACCLAIPFLITLAFASRPQTTLRSGRIVPSAGEVGRTPIFWILGISLFFSAHTLTGIQQHLVLYLTGQGVAAKSAALALSVLLGASAFGKILGGAAADKFSARMSLLMSIVCLVAGIGGLLAGDPAAAIVYWSAAMFGLGYGGVFNAPSIIAFEYFGTERVGAILGLYMMFFGLGTSSGGLLSGYIYDQTHNYANSFTWDLISCSIAFVLLFTLARTRSTLTTPLAAGAR